MVRALLLFASSLAFLSAGLLAAPQARAERGLTTGFADSVFDSADPAERVFWLDRSVEAGAGLVLIFPSWRGLTSGQPAVPTDPADPAYSFDILDAAVTEASARGLEVVLAVTYAPDYAEGQGRPGFIVPGTWKPDAAAFGDFAEALASRYSGSFIPAGALAPLPRVGYYQPWTEPNLRSHLAPQYKSRGAPFSPILYRRLLNAFYDGVKAITPSAKIVTAGTAPYGDPSSTGSLTPVLFWRQVTCLRGRQELRPTSCPQRPKFDVFAHNAITLPGGPTEPAALPDNASTADFGKLRRVVRAAERKRTVVPAGRRPLWSTEMWWDSRPPGDSGVPLQRHARWTQQALHVLWKKGASAAINLLVRDNSVLDAGLYFADGTPKPALQAFRFPFVCERAGAKRTTAWGKAPVAGELVIERRVGGSWRPVRSVVVNAGEVFEETLGLGGRQSFRARVGEEVSLTWNQR